MNHQNKRRKTKSLDKHLNQLAMHSVQRSMVSSNDPQFTTQVKVIGQKVGVVYCGCVRIWVWLSVNFAFLSIMLLCDHIPRPVSKNVQATTGQLQPSIRSCN